jgi:hypothetical protein
MLMRISWSFNALVIAPLAYWLPWIGVEDFGQALGF